MHTVFIQATFFKSSNLTLHLLKEIIQFLLRIIVKFPFNRMTTLLPQPLLTAWGCSDCCLGLTTQPFMVLKPECEEGVKSMQDPGQLERNVWEEARERLEPN